MKKIKLYAAYIIFLSITLHTAHATHIKSIEIRAEQINCPSLTYRITLIAYLNAHTVNHIGGELSELSLGDGTIINLPETEGPVIDKKLGISKVIIATVHTYSNTGTYLISYMEKNRNGGVLNMSSSVSTAYRTETAIVIESSQCNSSPNLLIPPIDWACRGAIFYHNVGAVDKDGDSLSYELTTPLRDLNTPVADYLYPSNPKFYSGNYDQSNEAKNGVPKFAVSQTGTLIWDAPDMEGEYTVAIKVRQWRYFLRDRTWHDMGFVLRDMQIIVSDCKNKRPSLNVPADLCAIAGKPFDYFVPATDPDQDPVAIEAFGDILGEASDSVRTAPVNGTVQPTINHHAGINLSWVPTCAEVRAKPYVITLKITDRPDSGSRLAMYKTVSIQVVAQAPVYQKSYVNPVNKTVTLQWAPYDCREDVTIQVWRRISEFSYDQPDCSAGMPEFLHYTLIGEVNNSATSFTDTNLNTGAQYCYRLVALVGPHKIPSRVSEDQCFIPKPAEAPVITNVSVQKTDGDAGEILVRWTSPFEIDRQQYPGPYLYKVYRSNVDENTTPVLMTQNPIPDTVFLDRTANSDQHSYRYHVQLFVPRLTDVPVDSSAKSSSVRLDIKPSPQSLVLTWKAETPWSNYTRSNPYHLIYRSDTGPQGEFILIDSVDVNQNGFTYTDQGQYKQKTLIQYVRYYYKILTRGSYGNPKLPSPLENFSQIAGSELLDIIPPCAPIVSIAANECSNFSCDGKSYYNKLTWQPENEICADDSYQFEILAADNQDEPYTRVGLTTDYFFLHDRLNTLAKCYRVVAIDRAGNRSDSSQVVCNDNCPYFELPNVFTPGATDGVNDQFEAYTNESVHCARFVKKVDLTIYDRWGTEIFTKSLDSNGEYVFWDGSTQSGPAAGVYFYSANVLFDARDPEKGNRIIKGWVKVIR